MPPISAVKFMQIYCYRFRLSFVVELVYFRIYNKRAANLDLGSLKCSLIFEAACWFNPVGFYLILDHQFSRWV